MSRYTLTCADWAGSWSVLSSNDLPSLADQLQWWQAQGQPSRSYFIQDNESDPPCRVEEERIESALETFRDRRDALAAQAANQEEA